jgi:membrane protease YdiL (CAAX protease family)
MMALLRRHPVIAYFAVTFAISWGGVLLIIGASGGMAGTKAQDNPLFPLALVAMVAGPSLASLGLTWLLDGAAGLRQLASRALQWRVGIRWYAVALLAAPLMSLTAAWFLSLFSPELVPAIWLASDKAALVSLALVVAVTAGVFEELGWTGFAIPRLRRTHGVPATGVIVGLLWSAWHILVVAWGIGDRAGTLPLAVFILIDGLAGLPAFRVLMVWVYDRTESLLIAVLMHFSLTASVLMLAPSIKGALLLSHGLVYAGLVWISLAVVWTGYGVRGRGYGVRGTGYGVGGKAVRGGD